MVYFGQRFENYRSSPYFCDAFLRSSGFALNFGKKRVGQRFGLLKRTHLVTLITINIHLTKHPSKYHGITNPSIQ
jgi:hypothetical protein